MTEEKDRIQEKVERFLNFFDQLQANSLKKEIHSLIQRHENDKRVIIKQRAKLKGIATFTVVFNTFRSGRC